jgi:hypothetical protein
VDRLSPEGWDALRAYGVRTIIDLRNDDERAEGCSRRSSGPSREGAWSWTGRPYVPGLLSSELQR